jgi:hypothetical protein
VPVALCLATDGMHDLTAARPAWVGPGTSRKCVVSTPIHALAATTARTGPMLEAPVQWHRGMRASYQCRDAEW